MTSLKQSWYNFLLKNGYTCGVGSSLLVENFFIEKIKIPIASITKSLKFIQWAKLVMRISWVHVYLKIKWKYNTWLTNKHEKNNTFINIYCTRIYDKKTK